MIYEGGRFRCWHLMAMWLGHSVNKVEYCTHVMSVGHVGLLHTCDRYTYGTLLFW